MWVRRAFIGGRFGVLLGGRIDGLRISFDLSNYCLEEIDFGVWDGWMVGCVCGGWIDGCG